MSNAFRAAIAATPDVADKWQTGKQAMGPDSPRVVLADNRKCDGSLDIDSALLAAQPNAARWDYALMYADRVVYIEVHPAASGTNINEVLAKVRWLRQWLANQARALHALPRHPSPFVWIASGSTDLRPSGAQRLALAEAGIKTMSRLYLN